MSTPIVHVVHCIDTEGPLDEDIAATFTRLKELFGVSLAPSHETLEKLQRAEIDLGGNESEIARVFAPELLSYNRNWQQIREMLMRILSPEFRHQMEDAQGNGWVYSWHCMDHMGLPCNPRHKDMGYGNVFHFYRQILEETQSNQDEMNWHFHPLSLTLNPLAAATSYMNNMALLTHIIARRVIDDQWFPTVNRPGFHSERQDSHMFLEQWMPFDYANQAITQENIAQKDTQKGRFGNWQRAPQNWQGYHPHHDDYQREGQCRRWIFRCLNVGTRFRNLTEQHVEEAFIEARDHGSAILAFANHDYREIGKDVDAVRELLARIQPQYADVEIRFSGAEEAARAHIATKEPLTKPPRLASDLGDGHFTVRLTEGDMFGPSPFLAIKDLAGNYYHDNFDEVVPGKEWRYVLDEHTMPIPAIDTIAAATAGRHGFFDMTSQKPHS